MRLRLLGATVLMLASFSTAGAGMQERQTTVFKGTPSVKVSEGGIERLPETLSLDRAVNLACVISRIGDRYFWATRENTELTRHESGAFVTFLALNGSGYVRVIKSELKSAAALMSPTEARFDYVEHLAIGLRSVTYYGVAGK